MAERNDGMEDIKVGSHIRNRYSNVTYLVLAIYIRYLHKDMKYHAVIEYMNMYTQQRHTLKLDDIEDELNSEIYKVES